ncbi:nucleotidyl transferase AbiEii/AbiGii toxin family protein [Candidatus Poriferisodalis sp.]|uniref:nucleotidyl transferase AbiEii/AbiGii toxin family protein n=1 Tax=Candidatus Poriferisodalis sp. TaxID=3101277 RepID=UPI003B0234B1
MNTRPAAPHAWEPADLVQHQIVSVIASRQQDRPRVVFKGGTLLRVCYSHDYRYSEDLDFDWIHPDTTKESIRHFFDGVARRTQDRYNTSVTTRWGAQKLHLQWQTRDGQAGVIDTDVKRRTAHGVEPATALWPILPRHDSVDTSHPILGYTLESVLAAKFDCIANQQRLAPRDYYDLFRLLQDQRIDLDEAIREFAQRHKLQAPHVRPDADWFEIIFTGAHQNLEELTHRWEGLLQTGMIPEPHHDLDHLLDTITGAAQEPILAYTEARSASNIPAKPRRRSLGR